ncbi:hypothetical protein MS3_00001319 [Schistosoma haematobium]|uniref:Uncharacterized protein n=1 Tax=Schistosoma haematobium TaxID=6185 RepID=A0A922IGB7_SCHHA|nr:uncharacterized protein MS3_00001319 [Schistosoma haematobium]KAH9578589.1 hypothetical protein MS3_00001319 [Schistosoma haematobium]
MMASVILQVSAPYSRTVLTFVLEILTLLLVDSCFEFEMLFSCKYVAFALPIRVFTSPLDSLRSLMMLPRYVKVFTSPKSSSSVIRLLHAVLYRRILLFPLCMLRRTTAEAAVKLVVFCSCCCVC